MARPLRFDYPGAKHHVYNRAPNKQPIFLDRFDEQTLLDLASELEERFGVVVLGFCLMRTHFHFIVVSTEGRLSQAMHWLTNAYVKRFNRRHGRRGSLFEGRYGNVVVQDGVYSLELFRYVHNNPVEAGMVVRAEDHLLSSYRSYLGLAPTPEWLDTSYYLGQFDSLDAIRDFTRARTKHPKIVAAIERGGEILGTKEFQEDVVRRAKHAALTSSRLAERHDDPPSIEDVVAGTMACMPGSREEILQRGFGATAPCRAVAIYLSRTLC